MKTILPLLLVCLLALVACQVHDLPPEYQERIEAVEADMAGAELLIEDEAEKERVLRRLEAERTRLIQDGLRAEYGWVGSLIGSLGVPPFLADWWPALAALLFERPRRQLKRASGKLVRGQVLGFVLDLLSVLGLKDSTAASKTAAELAPITEPAK